MNITPLTDRQKEILRRLEELHEAQIPFLKAMSLEAANASPMSFADFQTLGHNAEEIRALYDELIWSMRPLR
jgi:hypothetical protein